jgi:hypothetical protein
MHLRLEKREDQWHASADGIPEARALASNYEQALSELLGLFSKLLQRASMKPPHALDVFIQQGDQHYLVQCKHLLECTSSLASHLGENLKQALDQNDVARAVPLSAARSQVDAAAILLRQVLVQYYPAPIDIGEGPPITEGEESLLRMREEDVISGRTATKSLADVLTDLSEHR